MYKLKGGQTSESPLSGALSLDLSGWAYIRTEMNKETKFKILFPLLP